MPWPTKDVKELRETWMRLYLNLNLLLSTDPKAMKLLEDFKGRLVEMNEEFMPFFDALEKPVEFFKKPVEELVGITKMEEFEHIEEIKGSCPKCGGPLEFREHIDAFNEDGSPSAEDTYRDPYCPSCKLFWLGQEAS